jgi:enamine deaminase RidA (YjgF/YER057c/UK114 family)
MSDIERIETNPRLSRGVIYNGFVFLCGLTADDLGLDIRGQTEQALAKVEKYLNVAGTNKSRLLTTQIWLKDISRDFAGMNEVWESWTAPNASPTRATAQCEMAAPNLLVEIIATAAVLPYQYFAGHMK